MVSHLQVSPILPPVIGELRTAINDHVKELDQREQLLKKHLVSLFGYSGSDLNRFGNVFANSLKPSR
jgi:hypothetical protein